LFRNVFPKGPLRREPGVMTIRVEPSERMVESSIREAVGKLGWVFVEKREILGMTVITFRK